MPCPRFWLEDESGLAEESIDEIGLLLDAVQLVPHRGGERSVVWARLLDLAWTDFPAGIITE